MGAKRRTFEDKGEINFLTLANQPEATEAAIEWADSVKQRMMNRSSAADDNADELTTEPLNEKMVVPEDSQQSESLNPDSVVAPHPTLTLDGFEYRSGAMLADQESVETHAGTKTETAFRWGPILLPKGAEKSNACIVGMPRTGKTTLIRLMIQSTGWRSGSSRVVVYDEKSEMVSGLFSSDAELEKNGHLLNPFDSRSSAWDIAKDARNQHEANEVARLLIPGKSPENTFFVEGPRAIVAAAIVTLHEVRGEAWGLMDLLLVLRPENLGEFLEQSSIGESVYSTFLSSSHGSESDLQKTIAAKLAPWHPVAAAWERCKKRISLREWAACGSGVLVFGSSNAFSSAMQIANRTMISLLVEALLDRGPQSEVDTYVSLDEFQSLGYINGLQNLLRTGPGLGVSTVLGVHDIGLLREHYGQQAEGILAMCSHFALLRTNSRETSQWASDLLGKQEICQYRTSVSEIEAVDGAQTPDDSEFTRRTVTKSEHVFTRPIVEPGEFLRLPLASAEGGIHGYFASTAHSCYRGHLRGPRVFPPGSTLDNSGKNHAHMRLFEGELANFSQASNLSFHYRDHFEYALPINTEIAAKTVVVDGCEATIAQALAVAENEGLELVMFPAEQLEEPVSCIVMRAPWIEEETDDEDADADTTAVSDETPIETDYDFQRVERIPLA